MCLPYAPILSSNSEARQWKAHTGLGRCCSGCVCTCVCVRQRESERKRERLPVITCHSGQHYSPQRQPQRLSDTEREVICQTERSVRFGIFGIPFAFIYFVAQLGYMSGLTCVHTLGEGYPHRRWGFIHTDRTPLPYKHHSHPSHCRVQRLPWLPESQQDSGVLCPGAIEASALHGRGG